LVVDRAIEKMEMNILRIDASGRGQTRAFVDKGEQSTAFADANLQYESFEPTPTPTRVNIEPGTADSGEIDRTIRLSSYRKFVMLAAKSALLFVVCHID
jgi:hypothetical protein